MCVRIFFPTLKTPKTGKVKPLEIAASVVVATSLLVQIVLRQHKDKIVAFSRFRTYGFGE